jgi:hypothetical protein
MELKIACYWHSGDLTMLLLEKDTIAVEPMEQSMARPLKMFLPYVYGYI